MAQLAIAVTALGAGLYKGVQGRKAKYGEAESALEAADRRKAAMTRDIDYAEKKRETIESRARAVAAMQGGGGLGTPGFTSIIGDLNAEGEYDVLATMYLGQEQADALTYRAEAARREGDALMTAGVIEGISSAVSSYYGMGGFGSSWDPKAKKTTQTRGPTIPGHGYKGAIG